MSKKTKYLRKAKDLRPDRAQTYAGLPLGSKMEHFTKIINGTRP